MLPLRRPPGGELGTRSLGMAGDGTGAKDYKPLLSLRVINVCSDAFKKRTAM